MSRFVGQIGTRGDILKEAGGTVTGEIIVPTTNVNNTELVSLTRMCACVGPGNPNRSQCVFTLFTGCCQSAGGGDNSTGCQWTVPTGVQRIFVQMWGAGGGGGRGCGPAGRGMGHPGGGGAFAQWAMCVTAAETYCLKVGSGGTGQTYGGQGCQGNCSRFCGTGIDVNAFGGSGGPACSCCFCCAPGGTVSVSLDTKVVPGTMLCMPGSPAIKMGPNCACGGCCRPGGNRGGNAAAGGWGASGTCRGRCHCSDSGGCFACGFGGGGAGGTGHGSGQGLYSTPCCRGGRGAAGMILIWI